MAVYDRDNAKVVVRVVYDGPGNAGKTTNLVQMCQFFTTLRRSELVSPEQRDGRTMWFDWLQIDAGLVAGHGLRCQIVTVPGQVVLRRRRSVLLRAADVVVLVCDSTPAGLGLVRPAFGRIRQFVAEHTGGEVPIVLQANKQDLPEALTPEQIAESLGADASIPVIGARANAGVGVKETLVLAIRAAANRAQRLVLERGIDSLAGVPDDADSVLGELRRLGDADDEMLAPMLARTTFVEDVPTATPPVVEPAPVTEVIAAPEPAPVTQPEPAPAAVPDWWPVPPLRDTFIAPGCLWPAATGREALRRLASAELHPRLDLVAQRGDGDGSGKSSTVVYDGGGWCLKTSRSRRFDDLDAARVALVKLARTKISLGALTLPSTVLVVGGGPAGGHWVWTLAPWRTTLRATLTEALAAGDAAGLEAALGQFAAAVTESLVRAVRAGQGLDLHPSNFALDDGRLVYLDDEVAPAPPVPGAAHAILQRAEELAGDPAAVAHYGAALADGLAARLGPDDLARLRLIEDLAAAAPRAYTARTLRHRLLVAYGVDEPAPMAHAPVVAPTSAAVAAGPPADAPVTAPDEPAAAMPDVLAASAPGEPAERWPMPPTAAESLPSGFIWPVIAGRELIRQLASRTPTPRADLPFTYEIGGYTMSTSSQRRFVEVDDGRAELLRLARAHVASGAPPDVTVLMLAPDDRRGGHWIWTIAPIAGEARAAP